MEEGLEGLNIAVLLEEGINEVEYHYSRLRLSEAGADVTIIGNQSIEYTGELFEKLHADITIDQADSKNFDGVVIPGGLAPEKLRLNPGIVDFLVEKDKRFKLLKNSQARAITSASASGVSGPTRSTSHWKNSRARPF